MNVITFHALIKEMKRMILLFQIKVNKKNIVNKLICSVIIKL